MKSLEERWKEQNEAGFNITPPSYIVPEFTFKNTEVTDEAREAFIKMMNEKNRKRV